MYAFNTPVCVYIYVCVYMYAYVQYICLCIYVCVCVYICIYACERAPLEKFEADPSLLAA